MAQPVTVNDQITDAAAPEAAVAQLSVGRFVWHDLVTPDIEKAQKYYADLVGWTYKEFDMGPGGKYTMIHAGGTDWGGFMPLHPERGVPPHWISYVTVPDVDAAAAKAQELGGKVLVPGTDIPTVGRFAVIEGPTGGTISPFKPETPGEMPAPAPAPGTFVWHELLAKDPQQDGKFFSEIFGWRIEETPMGQKATYYLFKRLDTGKDAGGLMQKPQGDPGPSSWLTYIQVESADATAARTTELGGKVHVPPTDIPNVGRFTVTSDPQGAYIAFLQPAM
ncbi:MAG TPA: VOC family protein [Thermoanaerobaculia bacterium]|nr:VOC family protein [Thermoanaerobaculia bacterium]